MVVTQLARAVEPVITDIAFRTGLFSHPDPPPPDVDFMFAAVVIMAVVPALFTPVAIKSFLRNESRE